ncbi:hypothetical protein [Rhodococcus marinonascens]|uniref:hypothetical protein n=1 Tax=Rhodococcus marinonascens TaxID=38311 RepID=UPI000932DD52|nr:hypothetical protein [Rhodococcus marinonascens]
MSTVDARGELSRLVEQVAALDRVAGHSVREAATAFRAPIRVQTTGRAGVGRSTVAAALTASEITGAVIEESDAVDVPDAPDPTLDGDVVVYVLVESLRDADREAVRTLDSARVLVVLNKSDTVGESRAPDVVWSSAVARAADCAADCGFATLPLIGSLAITAVPSDSDLAVLLTCPGDLEGRWGAYGVACAGVAVAANPELDAAGLGALLRDASGSGAMSAAVTDRVERIRAQRAEGLLRALRSPAVRSGSARDVLEKYLAGDDAVALGAEAARLHLGDWASDAPGLPQTADDAVRCADWWRAQLSGQLSARQRRAVVEIRRHYIRLWQQMSGSRSA